MKGAVKKVRRWKKIIAWMLTAAIVAGNVSELTMTTSYASQEIQSKEYKDAAEVKVVITQAQIQKILKRDPEDQPEFNEDKVPFKGNKKEALVNKLYELMEGKTLIKQGSVANGVYLVVVDSEASFDSEEELFSHIDIIAVNGYEDRDYHFLIQIQGTNMVVESAEESWYQIAGDDEEEPQVQIATSTQADKKDEEEHKIEDPSPTEGQPSGTLDENGTNTQKTETEEGIAGPQSPEAESEKPTEAQPQETVKEEPTETQTPETESEKPTESQPQETEKEEPTETQAPETESEKPTETQAPETESEKPTESQSQETEIQPEMTVSMNSGLSISVHKVSVVGEPIEQDGAQGGNEEGQNSGDEGGNSVDEEKSDEGEKSVDEEKSGEGGNAADEEKSEEGGNAADEEKSEEGGNAADEEKSEEGGSAADEEKSGEGGSAVDEEKSEEGENSVDGEKSEEVESAVDEVKSEEGESAEGKDESHEAGGSENKENVETNTGANETGNSTGSKGGAGTSLLGASESAKQETEYDVYPLLEGEELGQEAIERLMGHKKVEEGAKQKRSLLRLEANNSADEFYPLIVSKSGISILSSDVTQQQDIFSLAEEYWGDEEDHRRIGEVKLRSDHTGDTKAGEPFHLNLTYAATPRPVYTFNAGSVNFYKDIENVTLSVTVPDQLIIEHQGNPQNNDDGTHTYSIPVGTLNTSGSKELTCYFAGNGEVALGTVYNLNAQTSVTFTGTILIKDVTGESDKAVSYTVVDVGAEAEDSEEDPDALLEWTMVSPNEWTVTKTMVNDGGKGIPEDIEINGETKKAVKFEYTLAVGLKENEEIQSEDKYYFDTGRAAFESFALTDVVEIETGVMPLKMTMNLKGQEPKAVYGTNSITIDAYNTKGFNGEATEYHHTAQTAPSYSEYYVTVYYPYEAFELDYWDPRVDDQSTYKVNNQASITYQYKGRTEAEPEASSQVVGGYYQYANGYQQITIKKNLTIPVFGKDTFDQIPYSAEYAATYPGYASFTIEKKNEAGAYEAYPLERIMIASDGQFTPIGQLVINPLSDEQDGGKNVQGEDGSISFYVEAGEYRITEDHQPADTQNEKNEPEEVDVRGNEATVIFNNRVINKGGIQFVKAGQVFENNRPSEKIVPVEGAKFGIYKNASDTEPVLTVESDKDGVVKFYPLDQGTYVVRELSAPENYVADTQAQYTAVVPENSIGGISGNGVSENTIINKSNYAALKVTKYVKDLQNNTYKPLTTDFDSFKRVFAIERKAGDGWETLETLIGLGGTSVPRESFIRSLPVYKISEDGTKSPITYRVRETIPAGYTAETIEGEQTYQEEGTVRSVITEPFTLEEAFKDQKEKEISVKNIPRGSLQLKKKNVQYEQQGNEQLLRKTNAENKDFYLLRKNGSDYEQVGRNRTGTGQNAGNILFNNLDIQDQNGNPIEYYWYEVPEEGWKLYAYDGDYDSEKKPKSMLTKADINIDGRQVSQADLIGPFQVNTEPDGAITTAYAYNVMQKVPFWVIKKDEATRSEILWNQGGESEDWKFSFTVYETVDGRDQIVGEAHNDGKPVYLQVGKQYKIKETKTPGDYSGYIGDESKKDSDGTYYQTIDLRNRTPISLESNKISNKEDGLTVEFINKQKKLLSVKKLFKDQFDAEGVENSDIKVRFSVYRLKEENGKKKFVQATETLFEAGKAYYVDPGVYYVKEDEIPKGYINPAFYLSDKGSLKNGLAYQKVNKEIYYGPIEVSAEQQKGIPVEITVENVKNEGKLQVYKYDASTGQKIAGARIEVYKEKNDSLPDGERTASANLKYANGFSIKNEHKGTANFPSLPVYDTATGKKITYVIKEKTAPNGYDLDPTLYEVTLEPGVLVNKVKAESGGEKEIAFYDNPLQTIVAYKYWHNIWGSHFTDIKNELPGVQLALYVQNEDGKELTHVQTVTTGEDGSAWFKGADNKGLDRTKDYYVIEVYEHQTYGMPDGKKALAEPGEGVPPQLNPADISRYNYIQFAALPKNNTEIERRGEILNEESWVQFNLTKYAEKELSTEQKDGYTEPIIIGGTTYYAKELNKKVEINGAKFELYQQETEGPGALNPSDLGVLVGTYETGTRLDENGKPYPGQFMTTILKPGKVYWLKEISSGPGFTMGDDTKLIAFVPSNGYSADNNVEIITYEKNKTTYEEMKNYKNGPGMEGAGLFAYVKLNKWLDEDEDGKGTLKPLGGVTFELRIAGKTYSVLETGLENDFNNGPVDNPTAQAMSGLLAYDDIKKDLDIRLEEGTITQEQYDACVNDKDKVITFELTEVKAPERVELINKSYSVEVEFDENGKVNKQYYYDEAQRTGTPLINKVVKGYPVTLKIWGYRPLDEMFAEGSPLVNDQFLEAKEDLDAVLLRNPRLNLQKREGDGTYKNYRFDGRNSEFNTEKGIYVFPDGLPAGHYRLKVNTLNDDKYYNMYKVGTGYYREFTVDQTQNVINIYNPEKPSLKLTKKTLLGEKVDFSNLKFQLTGAGTYNGSLTGNEDTLLFRNIEPGRYTINEELQHDYDNKMVTPKYFGKYNQTQLAIGFERKKNADGVYLSKLQESLPLNPGEEYMAEITLKNPRKASLSVKKVDSENNGTPLRGAKFRCSWLPFTDDDFTVTASGELQFKYPDGPVTDPDLKAMVSQKSWNGFSNPEETNSDGIAVFKNRDPGWYKIIEDTAPKGYEKSTEAYYVAVTADMTGTFIEVTDGGVVTNKKHVEKLTITKALDFGNASYNMPDSAMERMAFELYLGKTENNQFKGEKVENKTAVIRRDSFQEGSISTAVEIDDIRQLTDEEIASGTAYYLKEEVSDISWRLKDAKQGETPLEITADGYIRLPGFNTSEPVALTVTNQYLKADLELKKTDQNKPEKLLPGAEFKVYDSQEVNEKGEPTGKLLGTSTDKGNGIYEITGIPVEGVERICYVFETKAPELYVQRKEPVVVTLHPGERLTWEMNESLIIPNENGVDISLVKYKDIKENAGQYDIQDSDVVFNLYSTTTPDDPNAVWTLEERDCRPQEASQGRLEWRGLSIAEGKTYAVYEQPITSGKYENYTLESVWGTQGAVGTVHVRTSEEPDKTKTLYVLEGVTAGNKWEFQAYNKPAVSITIQKRNYNYGAGDLSIPSAIFEVRKEDGTLVKSNIKTSWTVGTAKTYSEATIQLEEGTYRIREIEADDGYSLLEDDARVIRELTVKVPDAEKNNTYTFVNMKVNNSLALSKDVTSTVRELKNLWWNDNQSVSYQVRPSVLNDSALTGFSVKDEGLVMVSGQNQELNQKGEENPYTNEKYSFTRVRIPVPAQGSYLLDTEGNEIKQEDIGRITAKITWEFFGGETEEQEAVVKENLDGDGFWSVTPQTDQKVKAFTIEYYDEAIREKTGGKYALGQGFDPGAIEVEALINQQEIGSSEDHMETTAVVRNYAKTVMNYLSFDEKGSSSQKSLERTAHADITVLEPDIPTIAIGLSVENIENPKTEGGQIEIDDKLRYTMTLENVSDRETIKTPMINPLFLNKFPKGVIPDLSTVRVTVNGNEVTWNEDEVITKIDSGGYCYLYVPFIGSFWSEDSITITVDTSVKSGVISNGAEVRDELFVTSTSQNPAFTNNYGGATFKVRNEHQEMESWPGVVTGTGVEEIAGHLGLPRNNGYAATYVKNVFNTDSGVTLFKEGRGNVDVDAGTGFVSDLTSAKVTKDGEITYHLITKNTSGSEKTLVTGLRVLDILPTPSGKEDYDGTNRGSEWQFQFKPGTIRLYKVSDSGEETEVDGFTSYYLPEGEALRKTVLSKFANPLQAGWVTAVPENQRVAAIMVDTESQMKLAANEMLVVEYQAKVQDINTEEELERLAYKYSVNNFSIQYKYQEGEGSVEKLNEFTLTSNLVQALLIPQRVGVGGRIWIDANGNGIQDDQDYGTEADLQKLIKNNYFNVGLRSWGEESGITSAGNGEIEANPLENVPVIPQGTLTSNGEFLFRGLLPAQPHTESSLYSPVKDQEGYNTIRNQLNKKNLKGSSPETHRLSITTKGEESAEIIPGMILEKSPTTTRKSDTGIASNNEGGKSRKPAELLSYPNEMQDNNFAGKADSYYSEDFFLWADTARWDRTKDFGIVPYRNLTLTKTGESGEPVKGANFTIYGPFAPGEAAEPIESKVIYQGKTDESGALKDIPKLLYYMNYLIVEEETAPNYVLEGASSSLEAYQGQKTGWILGAAVTKAEIKNKYETGSLIFDKVDESNGSGLPGAVFSLSKAGEQGEFDNVNQSMKAFREKALSWTLKEQEAMGITDIDVKEEKLYFTTTGKQVTINGLPNGRYVLKEEQAPKDYNGLTDQNEFEFTIKGSITAELKGAEGNVITNKRGQFDLIWNKKDTFGNSLRDVEFTIEGPGSYDEILGFKRFKPDDDAGIKTVKTDENGVIALSLSFGDYKVTERAPAGYKPSEPFYIRVSSENGTVGLVPNQVERSDISFEDKAVSFTVVNSPATGSLEMEKVDADDKGRKLTGAEFALTGNSVIAGAWGDYLSDLSKIYGSGVEILMADPETGTLHFKIVGTNGILGKNNGRGLLTGIPYGTYTLTETKAPEGYILTGSPWSRGFTVNEKASEIQFISSGLFNKTEGAIENQPSRLTVVKTNAVLADTRLEGAEFLMKALDGTYVKLDKGTFAGYTSDEKEAGRLITDRDGQYVVWRLPAGTYSLIETKAPEGYEINPNIPSITFDGINSFTITVQDVKIKGGDSTDSGSGGGGSGGGGGGSDFTKGPGRSNEGGPGTSPDDLVTILPDEVPLANLPADTTSDMLLVIDDGDIPLARLPKTGDKKNSAGKMMVAVSGIMLALYAALSKKKKQN